jgi:hypothetical protein
MSKGNKTLEQVEKLVDFNVVRENWNAYELEDGTIIRTKPVLMNITDAEPSDGDKRKLSFSTQSLVAQFSPMEVRGKTDQRYQTEELEKYVTHPKVRFKQTKNGGDCIYETKNSLILLRQTVNQIDKTSKYNSDGMPAYIVRSGIEMIAQSRNVKAVKEATESKL